MHLQVVVDVVVIDISTQTMMIIMLPQKSNVFRGRKTVKSLFSFVQENMGGGWFALVGGQLFSIIQQFIGNVAHFASISASIAILQS